MLFLNWLNFSINLDDSPDSTDASAVPKPAETTSDKEINPNKETLVVSKIKSEAPSKPTTISSNNSIAPANTSEKSYYDNMFSLIFNSADANSKSTAASGTGAIPVVTANSIGTVGGFEIFSLNKNTITIQKPSSSSSKPQQAQSSHHHQQPSAANLSNFLNVRFEITQNQAGQDAAKTSTSSSSKSSKYRKSIKITSVSCRPLSSLESGDTSSPDIQLKAYEFTEKCLSFRLASIDLNSDQQQQRRNFQAIKLTNT